jgi:hypothetical protein
MLRLTSKGNVRFSWVDEAMEALFNLNPGDSEEELLSKLQRMLEFVQARRTPLPQRVPGLALEQAQTMQDIQREAMGLPAQGNGWAAAAAAPDLPEDRKGEWEMIPKEEQG